MKQDEAEKLARFALERGLKSFSDEDVLNLCRYIVGDMRREIENAAFERAANECQSGARLTRFDDWRRAYTNCANAIRSLIQPAAQKDEKK